MFSKRAVFREAQIPLSNWMNLLFLPMTLWCVFMGAHIKKFEQIQCFLEKVTASSWRNITRNLGGYTQLLICHNERIYDVVNELRVESLEEFMVCREKHYSLVRDGNNVRIPPCHKIIVRILWNKIQNGCKFIAWSTFLTVITLPFL